MKRGVLTFQVTPEIAHEIGVFFFRSEMIWAWGMKLKTWQMWRIGPALPVASKLSIYLLMQTDGRGLEEISISFNSFQSWDILTASFAAWVYSASVVDSGVASSKTKTLPGHPPIMNAWTRTRKLPSCSIWKSSPGSLGLPKTWTGQNLNWNQSDRMGFEVARRNLSDLLFSILVIFVIETLCFVGRPR